MSSNSEVGDLKMKILVTGGSGYLGTHICRFFAADDFSRRSGRDILDPEALGIVGEYDVVIHLAALLDKNHENAEAVFQTNVEGTRNILRHLRNDAVFIFASSKDVYGRFADNYPEVNEQCPVIYSGQPPLEWSKLIAERYIEYYAARMGFRSCIFRLSTVYAPLSNGNIPGFVGAFAEAINLGEPIDLPDSGRPIRDLLYVDDFAAACEQFINSVIARGLYNLGGGRENAVSLNELVDLMEDVSGLQAIRNHSTDASGVVPRRYVTDYSLANTELGWKPKIDLRTGIARLFST